MQATNLTPEGQTVRRTKEILLAIFILIGAFELAFIKSLPVNIFILAIAVLFFAYERKYKSILALLLVPLLPAIGAYWSFSLYATDIAVAPVMASRTYAYAALGLMLALGVNLQELLLTLEQYGLPVNFVYGLLVVIHALPAIRNEVANLRLASSLRGKNLHFYSPMLYIKVIMTSFVWSEHYTTAMYAHGYDDGVKRTTFYKYQLSLRHGLIIFVVFIAAHFLLLIN